MIDDVDPVSGELAWRTDLETALSAGPGVGEGPGVAVGVFVGVGGTAGISAYTASKHAVIGLMLNMAQTLILVAAFYIMFSVLGMRGSAIRGNFLLYIMSGIFLFFAHIKAIAEVGWFGVTLLLPES